MPSVSSNLTPPPPAPFSELPSATSPNLEIVLATPEEYTQCALLNASSWSGPLSAEAYMRREAHLAAQAATIDGGLSNWILVDRTDNKKPRTILAACESHHKRALVAKPGREVTEVIAHGIGSVFSREEYRGKGYGLRLMGELRKKLEYWQQESGRKTDFTVLYSDIGKKFYAKNGWIPYPSAHVSLRIESERRGKYPEPKPLAANDLPSLCQKDEQMLRKSIGSFLPSGPHFRVALIPSSQTMAWHHAREEFLANELFGKTPQTKGAIVECQDSAKVWCIWTRRFAKDPKENVLYILRIVVEGEDQTNSVLSSKERIAAVAACLEAAQLEAHEWRLQSVQLWNPSPSVLAGSRKINPDIEVVHRDSDSIACLNWYGSNPGIDRVEWAANEKFGWC